MPEINGISVTANSMSVYRKIFSSVYFSPCVIGSIGRPAFS